MLAPSSVGSSSHRCQCRRFGWRQHRTHSRRQCGVNSPVGIGESCTLCVVPPGRVGRAARFFLLYEKRINFRAVPALTQFAIKVIEAGTP